MIRDLGRRLHEGMARAGISQTEATFHVVLLGLALLAAIAIESEHRSAIAEALADYRRDQRQLAESEARRIETSFRQIYQGIRTIARLPAVRSIDRYARGLDADARTSIQEIYNNLAENIDVSEVYIVPADFEPDAIDPQTGRSQEPIIQFDHLIAGRTADDALAPAAPPMVREVEIFEYRLMRRQLQALQQSFGFETSVPHLDYPAIGGEEVITCDNSHYSPAHPDDADRSGLVYSVPFYGPEGRLRGMISAVIRTDAIRDILGGPTHVLTNRAHGYVVGTRDEAFWPAHRGAIEAEATSASLLFSDLRPLAVTDIAGRWHLWSGTPDERFWRSAEVTVIGNRGWLRQILSVLAFAGIAAVTRYVAGKHGATERRNRELEARVQARTLELEEARREAERANLAKTRFLANMSHEIRTPIGSIVTMTELMQRGESGRTPREGLAIIQRSGQTLVDLVNQVLDLTAIEAGKLTLSPKRHILGQVIDDALDLFREPARARGLEIVTELDPGLPYSLVIDGGRLRQVLINLAGNAVKFTEKGRITVRAGPGARLPDGRLRLWLEVADTGAGIDKSAGVRLFEAFQQADPSIAARYGGSGLGLAICRRLVEMMGGEIGYDSTPGKGSTFYFTVVGSDPELGTSAGVASRAEPAAPRSSPATFAQARALLVEDHPVVRELTHDLLVRLGCRVDSVPTGEEALALLAGQTFDVVLMDCRLPGIDGLETARRIRDGERLAGRRPVPIIAISANAFAHDRAQCLEAGMSGFLGKPFTAEELQMALAEHLLQPAGEGKA